MKVKAFLIETGVSKKIEINKETIFYKDNMGGKGFITYIKNNEEHECFFISSESLSRAGVTERRLWYMNTSSQWIYLGSYIGHNGQIIFREELSHEIC